MHFLVTGGAGFIGSHLCDRLLAEGHQVTVLDNLSSGKLENLSSQVEFVLGEITDLPLMLRLMSRVDGCFHLAAIPSVVLSHQDWIGCSQVNLMGSLTVFDAARRLLPQKKIPVIYASSAAVYGENGETPLKENAPLNPLSAYGADKLSTELHAQVASHIHGVPTIGLRFFNVFGPRQDPSSPYSGVISIFIEKLKNKEPIPIFGDGEQTRDFIFVEDLVTALISAFNYGMNSTAPQIYNICTGVQNSINSLSQQIAEILQSPLDVQFLPPRKGDIRTSIGDPSRAKKDLDFTHKYDLKAGLSKMLSNREIYAQFN